MINKIKQALTITANRQTQQMIIITGTTIFSLGVVGYMIYSIGLVDMILWGVLQFAALFLMLLVVMTIIDPLVYNMIVDTAHDTVKAVMSKFAKGESPEDLEPQAA